MGVAAPRWRRLEVDTFACGLRRRVPHAGNGEVGRIASGSRALECYAGREAGEVVSLPASI